MVGLSVILNPDDNEFDSDRSFASALDTVCTDGSKTTDPGWLEALGELIGHGIDASKAVNDKTKNFNRDLTQAQQSGASNVAMASSLGPAAGIGAGLSLFPLLANFLPYNQPKTKLKN